MKKLFTSLLALSAVLTVSAEAPQFLHGDVALSNGATYEVGYTATERGPLTIYYWDAELFLKTSYDADMAIVVTADGSGTQICCFDQCAPVEPGSPATKNGTVFYDEPLDLEIHCQTYSLGADAITVTVTAYDVDTPDDKATVTVKLVPEDAETVADRQGAAGIVGVGADGNYVRLTASKTLGYNLPAATRLAIYNISGAKVYERTLSGEGALAIDRLPRGVYVYKAANLAGKFLVK